MEGEGVDITLPKHQVGQISVGQTSQSDKCHIRTNVTFGQTSHLDKSYSGASKHLIGQTFDGQMD
jgi:hypothetical protein